MSFSLLFKDSVSIPNYRKDPLYEEYNQENTHTHCSLFYSANALLTCELKRAQPLHKGQSSWCLVSFMHSTVWEKLTGTDGAGLYS